MDRISDGFSRRRMALLCGGALALLLAGGTAYAKPRVFDLVTEFTGTRNSDTTRWSYRLNLTGARDGNYDLLGYYDANGNMGGSLWELGKWLPNKKLLNIKYWNSHGTQTYGSSYPMLTANKMLKPWTTPTCGYGRHPITLPPRTLLMDAGNTGVVVVSFLAPYDTQATVAYDITHIDANCGNGFSWFIDLNGGQGDLASGSLNSNSFGDLATTGPQKLTLTLKKGARINLMIQPNTDITGDEAAVTETITLGK